ncbi:MAG: hypothetical protein JO057_11250 [Chloroflexi bacterium]|nr:hypothetical protein [Chloroflexota bacterium]
MPVEADIEAWTAVREAMGTDFTLMLDSGELQLSGGRQRTFNTTDEFGLERLSYGLTEPLRIDGEGYVHAPMRPGLGYDVDWEVINAGRIGELS